MLEDRTLLSALKVTTAGDVVDGNDGVLSLREAILIANDSSGITTYNGISSTDVADTITFDLGAGSHVILLTSGEFRISEDLTITGLGAELLTINAQSDSRIFLIDIGPTVEISGFTLTNGHAIDREDVLGGGGAIFNGGFLTVTGSRITGNVADFNGGGIYNHGTMTLTDSTVSGNSLIPPPPGGNGGVNVGTMTVTDSTISGNSTYVYGGGISNFSRLTVTGSTISGNSAGVWGGGLVNFGTLTVTDSTISGNSSQGSGGGLYNYNSSALIVTNSTFANNRADSDGSSGASEIGGGLAGDAANATLNNTIVAGNFRGIGVAADDISWAFGTVTAAKHNLIGDAGTSGGLTDGVSGNLVGVDVATVLDTVLRDNGGPTLTHALVAGSVAINAGNNTLAVDADDNPLVFDQRGAPFVRIAGGTVDIGAYEAQSLSLVVDTTDDLDDGDYSAGNLSLREAVNLAEDNPGGDTITFDASLAGATILLTGGQFTIIDNLAITGLGADHLTIDAQGYSRLFLINASATVEINGLTLTGGYDVRDGGGIWNAGTLRLTNSTLTGNSAVMRGGGIFNYGTLTVTNSTLSGNQATMIDSAGGGLFNSGTLTVTGSTLSGNSATYAGGIYNNGALTATNSTLSGNFADRGGGIYNGGTLMAKVTGSTLSDNSADSGGGGGIWNGGTLSLTSSTLSGNSASVGGGIFNHGSLTLTGSTLCGNTGGAGGGIVNYEGKLRLTNSTLSGNAASGGDGGGIWNAGTLCLISSTLSGNSAGDSGGGIYVYSGSVTLNNTIVAGNGTTTGMGDISGRVDASNSFNNLIGDAGSAGGIQNGVKGNIVGVDVDKVLDPVLRDNGGPTLTHALIAGSLAIDAGNNGRAVDADGNPLAFDQRGDRFRRVVGFGVDIGAFEAQIYLATTTTLTSSANSAAFGQPVTFTATVTAAVTPVGLTVIFIDTTTGVTLGTGQTNSSGVASLVANGLTVGAHVIRASVLGNAAYTASSDTLRQSIDRGTTTTRVVTSGSPTVLGRPVTFTATVSPNAPSTQVPTGMVTFVNLTTGMTLGTTALNNGVATLEVSSLTLGSHTIRAVYNSLGPYISSVGTVSLIVVGEVSKDFNGDGFGDVIELRRDGQWWIGVSNGTGAFQTSVWADWADAENFTHVDFGDFNGDGDADVIGLDRRGNVWAGLSDGASQFATSLWLSGLDESLAHVEVVDLNSDGASDLLAFTSDGRWLAALSNRTGFGAATVWTTWAGAASFAHLAVGDFSGDGRSDIAGFDQWGGWWIARGTDRTFTSPTLWGRWAASSEFASIETADFNGDGATDVAGFDLGGGWWVATSNFDPAGPTLGTAFDRTSLWADWNAATNFAKVGLGDFNSDGATDVAGFDQWGNWWTATSNFNPAGPSFGTAFRGARLWATWGNVASLREIDLYDFGGTDATDVAGFDANGQWRVGISNGSAFVENTFWSQWDPADRFATVNDALSIRLGLNRLRLS